MKTTAKTGLNPYYSGIYTSTETYKVITSEGQVLILIILEYTLLRISDARSGETYKGLNPYYSGIYTSTGTPKLHESSGLSLNPYYSGIYTSTLPSCTKY